MGEAFFGPGDLVFEASCLGVAGVGPFAGVKEFSEPLFELGAQVGVGTAAVEGGSVKRERILTSLDHDCCNYRLYPFAYYCRFILASTHQLGYRKGL